MEFEKVSVRGRWKVGRREIERKGTRDRDMKRGGGGERWKVRGRGEERDAKEVRERKWERSVKKGMGIDLK